MLKDKVEKLEAGNFFDKSGYDGRAQTVILGLPRSCCEIKEINSVLAPGEYIIVIICNEGILVNYI